MHWTRNLRVSDNPKARRPKCSLCILQYYHRPMN
ncbi:hypothetical protein [Sphaerochaeta pleomorpha]